MPWAPPGRDCGSCGMATCRAFANAVKKGKKTETDCPFYAVEQFATKEPARYSGTDITGALYDFVIRAFPGEPSARKFIVPFRADLVEKWDIRPGALVTGRPAGPGCPALPCAPGALRKSGHGGARVPHGRPARGTKGEGV